jgi:hypothetical protein
MPRLGPHHSINGDWQAGTGSAAFQTRESVYHRYVSTKSVDQEKEEEYEEKSKRKKKNAGPKSPFDTSSPSSNQSTASHQLFL